MDRVEWRITALSLVWKLMIAGPLYLVIWREQHYNVLSCEYAATCCKTSYPTTQLRTVLQIDSGTKANSKSTTPELGIKSADSHFKLLYSTLIAVEAYTGGPYLGDDL